MHQVKQRGFSLIEVLIVVAILALLATLILAAVTKSREKAYDTRIKNAVSQLRWEAETIYDTQNASYQDWTQHPTIQSQMSILLQDIDKNYGDPAGAPYVTTLRESQVEDYCISAPLRAISGKYVCIDRSALLKIVSSACPDYAEDDAPLVCPAS